nr:replication factor A protein 1-like [Ipomoea batatas]
MYQLQPFESLKTVDSTVLVGRNQVKCTVWDDYVEKVMPFFRSDLLEPVVILIQMGRIKLVEKSSEVKICSSYDATKLLLNQNTMDFVEFRESLCMQQQTPLKSITSNSTFSYGTTSRGDLSSSKMQITTFSEIFAKGDNGDFWVPCKIIGIESDPNDWFLKGVLRYKLKIRVVDINGTTPLLLWDREALELLCVKTDELKAMQPTVMTEIPKEMKNLKRRGLFLNIAVRNEQLDNLHNALPVMQVKHFPEMFEIYYHGFSLEDDAESPIATTSGKQNVAGNENEAVKRSLLDEFLSTQTSKQKKQIVVKEEKEPTGEQ